VQYHAHSNIILFLLSSLQSTQNIKVLSASNCLFDDSSDNIASAIALEIVVGWFILKYITVILQHVKLDCFPGALQMYTDKL